MESAITKTKLSVCVISRDIELDKEGRGLSVTYRLYGLSIVEFNPVENWIANEDQTAGVCQACVYSLAGEFQVQEDSGI